MTKRKKDKRPNNDLQHIIQKKQYKEYFQF